ncbi:hypothetical protein SLE2022_183430 [Rubroshorea leprosula]
MLLDNFLSFPLLKCRQKTLYHLYMTARGNLQRLLTKEVRILKYLLKTEDPEERLCALRDAFTLGEELERKEVDNLHTTPEKLHILMRNVWMHTTLEWQPWN